jgi:hypothetical protein
MGVGVFGKRRWERRKVGGGWLERDREKSGRRKRRRRRKRRGGGGRDKRQASQGARGENENEGTRSKSQDRRKGKHRKGVFVSKVTETKRKNTKRDFTTFTKEWDTAMTGGIDGFVWDWCRFRSRNDSREPKRKKNIRMMSVPQHINGRIL